MVNMAAGCAATHHNERPAGLASVLGPHTEDDATQRSVHCRPMRSCCRAMPTCRPLCRWLSMFSPLPRRSSADWASLQTQLRCGVAIFEMLQPPRRAQRHMVRHCRAAASAA